MGTDEASFVELFLGEDELVPALRRVQDTRRSGPDPGDRPFARNQGVRAGFQVFTGAAGLLLGGPEGALQ